MPTNTSTAQRLSLGKSKVFERWEQRVQKELAPVPEDAHEQLRNSLPDVFDMLVAVLTDPDPQKVLRAKESMLAIGHGKIRAGDPSYSLDRVTDEFHILQQVIFEVLEEGGRPVIRQERNLILDVIMRSVRNAASAFKAAHDQQKERLRSDIKHANEALELAIRKKTSEAGLKEQLLNTIFERVQDYAIYTLNAFGEVSSWSEGCRQIKRYSAEEVMGRHYSMLYPPEGRVRREPEAHLEIAQREGRFRGEGLRMRKGGELFLADVFITPIYEAGELLGFFKIVADLTDRHRLIQEIDMSRARAEVLKLESELRDQFVSLLSHDLRNPLSAAHMNSELIARTTCNVENHAEMARRSIKHINRATEMITDLLDANQIKAGDAFPLKIREFDFVEMVKNLCDEQASVHGRRFSQNVPDQLVGFWDQSGLKRVLENLINNAIKYGKADGNITISVAESGDRVLVKVHNLGSPIHVQDQESLFKPFYRTSSASESSSHGWGLGLTLVRGIVEAHGGIVRVRSLPSEGTTFLLDLPRDSRKA